MRVTVTGGAGFIGSHLVAKLVCDGHAVTVLDNLRRSTFERPGLHDAVCIRGDVRDRATCLAAFAGADVVVHLAAQSNVMGSESDPDYTFTTNVVGTWEVVRAATEAGVRQLVFASSREVYGDVEEIPVLESAPIRPRNTYGASKAAAEAVLSGLGATAPSVSILRLANVIGPGDSGRVTPLWLDRARVGQPLQVFGGEQVLDLIAVDFVVDAVARVIARGGVPGAMNVGSGVGVAILDLARRILDLTGSESPVEVLSRRGPEVSRFCADTRRLRTELQLLPPANPLEAIEAWW